MKRITQKTLKAASLLSQKPKIAFYDLETTGIKHEYDRVIQFAGALAEYNSSTGRYAIKKRVCELSDPGFPVSQVIEDLTGITNDMLAGKPKEPEIFKIAKGLFDEADVISGYNSVKFDDLFINDMAERQGVANPLGDKPRIDVMEIAVELIAKSDVHTIVNGKDKYHTLENVSRYYGCSVEGFHDAMIDVTNTARVLFAEMRDLKSEPVVQPEKLTVIAMFGWHKSKICDKIYVTTIDLEGKEVQLEYDVFEHQFNTDGNYDPNDVYQQMIEARSSMGKKSWGGFKQWKV